MHSTIAAAAGVAAGVWMMAAPAVLGYAGPAATSGRIVGPTAAALAWIARSEVTRSLRWGNVALGAWAALAPLFLDHSAAAGAHGVAGGTLLIVSSLAMGDVPSRSYGGGWKALLPPRKRRRT